MTIGVRPDALAIGHAGNAGWHGRIAGLEHVGADLIVHVRLSDGNRAAVVRADPYGKPIPAAGTDVVLQPALQRTLLFDHAGTRIAGVAEIHQALAFA